MTAQLSLDPDEPGYFSVWAESKDRSSGSGGVSWHPSEAAARAYAVASFDRAHGAYRPEHRPVAARVSVELLLPGPDRGAWRGLSRDVRRGLAKDHPWFTSGETIA